MASENAAIKKVVTAAKAEERLSQKEKKQTLYVKGLEAKKRAAERTVRELREAPNMTQLVIGAGSSVAGGMGGFKLQKYLAGTTAAKAVNGKGEPTFGAKAIRTGVPVGAGILVALGGAFIPNGAVAAAVMGGGAGVAGGALTSALLDT
jgi:hypothetical protein